MKRKLLVYQKFRLRVDCTRETETSVFNTRETRRLFFTFSSIKPRDQDPWFARNSARIVVVVVVVVVKQHGCRTRRKLQLRGGKRKLGRFAIPMTRASPRVVSSLTKEENSKIDESRKEREREKKRRGNRVASKR